MTRYEALNILGLSVNATFSEGQAAYRRLLKVHHPDKGGDTAMTQRIIAAWKCLKDSLPTKRPASRSEASSETSRPSTGGTRTRTNNSVYVQWNTIQTLFRNDKYVQFRYFWQTIEPKHDPDLPTLKLRFISHGKSFDKYSDRDFIFGIFIYKHLLDVGIRVADWHYYEFVGLGAEFKALDPEDEKYLGKIIAGETYNVNIYRDGESENFDEFVIYEVSPGKFSLEPPSQRNNTNEEMLFVCEKCGSEQWVRLAAPEKRIHSFCYICDSFQTFNLKG